MTKKLSFKKMLGDARAARHDARELSVWSDHDQSTYRQQEAIKANLAKKMAAGKYDRKLARKGWMYAADTGSQTYGKEFNRQKGHAFSPLTRKIHANKQEISNRDDVKAMAQDILAKRASKKASGMRKREG